MTNKKNIVIKVKYPTPMDQDRDIDASKKMITEWNVKRIVIALAALILIISFSLYFFLSKQDAPNTPSQLSGETVGAEPEKSVALTPDQPSLPATNHAAPGSSSQPPESSVAPAFNETAAVKPEQVKNDEQGAASSQVEETDEPIQFKLSEANKVISNQAFNQIKEDIRSEKSATEIKEKAKETPPTQKKESPVKGRSAKVIRSVLAGSIINKEPVHILNSPIRVTKAKTVWLNYFTEFKGMNNNTVYHEWINNGRLVYKHRFDISADRWRAASRKPFNHTSGGIWKVRSVDAKGRLLDQKAFKVILTR